MLLSSDTAGESAMAASNISTVPLGISRGGNGSHVKGSARSKMMRPPLPMRGRTRVRSTSGGKRISAKRSHGGGVKNNISTSGSSGGVGNGGTSPGTSGRPKRSNARFFLLFLASIRVGYMLSSIPPNAVAFTGKAASCFDSSCFNHSQVLNSAFSWLFRASCRRRIWRVCNLTSHMRMSCFLLSLVTIAAKISRARAMLNRISRIFS
mmetsp:Transcript_118/g.897  ORF Transcript_118/g.897 Transcript_118/m.897 type:complete len:208 (+) Transcript_118:663-1286(+)